MDNDAIRPVRATWFHGDDEALARATYAGPPTWSQVPDILPDPHVLQVLEPAFRDDDGRRAAETTARWEADGVLVTDAEPAVWAYRILENGVTTTGVLLTIDLDSGLLRPHEDVIERYVDGQERLAAATGAHWEPITAYRHGNGPEDRLRHRLADRLGRAPTRAIRDGSRLDLLWRIDETATIDAVRRQVSSEPLVVADGHHRLHAWSRLTEPAGRRALVYVMDSDEIRVGSINRVVHRVALTELVDALAPTTTTVLHVSDLQAFLQRDERRAVLSDGTRLVGAETAACAACEVDDAVGRVTVAPEAGATFEPSRARALTAAAAGTTAVLLSAPSLETIDRAARTATPMPHKTSSIRPKPRVGLVVHRWR